MRGSPKAVREIKVHAVPDCEHDGVYSKCFGCLGNQNLVNGEAFPTRLVRLPRGARLAESADRLLPMLIRPALCYVGKNRARGVRFLPPGMEPTSGKGGALISGLGGTAKGW